MKYDAIETNITPAPLHTAYATPIGIDLKAIDKKKMLLYN